MKEIHFSDWREALAMAKDLDARRKRSFEITLRWYLNYCRRVRCGVNVQSARAFLEWAVQTKRPENWQVEGWKEAIRWFFKVGQGQSAAKKPLSKGVSLPVTEGPSASWREAFLTVVRRRNYSYRTEQTYLAWIERFESWAGTDGLANQDVSRIAAFLDTLAVRSPMSASSQRQALNALVFLYREVFGKEIPYEVFTTQTANLGFQAFGSLKVLRGQCGWSKMPSG